MRYSQTHKDETHARLVSIAGQALRKAGPDKLSVAEVMKEAGLTHGGFYAHFKSKDALLAEALEAVFAQSRERITKQLEGLPPRHALATFIDSYMSRRHRDNPEQGCPITALNSDLPRQSKAVRAVFDAGTRRLIAWVADLIGETGFEGDAGALAPSIVSAMAGAVAVSRAVSDKSLSDEMLETARTGIKAHLGVTDADLARSKLQ
ncbi:MAG: TetR/AcrR family transcriptional regulator [Pseudomonadota bacterium]|nr:TetR/AcrR family transcriptional regulator [Pseudomonadota bacterium]